MNVKNFIPNKAMAGVVDYVDARDIPGENDWQHGPSQVESSCKVCGGSSKRYCPKEYYTSRLLPLNSWEGNQEKISN